MGMFAARVANLLGALLDRRQLGEQPSRVLEKSLQGRRPSQQLSHLRLVLQREQELLLGKRPSALGVEEREHFPQAREGQPALLVETLRDTAPTVRG